jgi:hypothetical protein
MVAQEVLATIFRVILIEGWGRGSEQERRQNDSD